MEFHADLMLLDYKALHIFLHRNRRTGLKTWMYLLFTGFMVTVGLTILQTKALIDLNTNGVITAFVLAFLLAYLSFFQVNMLLQKRLLPEPNSPLLGSQTISCKDTGIWCRSERMEIFLAWSAITSMGETRRHLFLFVDACTNLVLPKRCLGSSAEMQALVDLIRTSCPNLQAESRCD